MNLSVDNSLEPKCSSYMSVFKQPNLEFFQLQIILFVPFILFVFTFFFCLPVSNFQSLRSRASSMLSPLALIRVPVIIFAFRVVFGRPLFLNTFKYHVFAPMGRFQLELIYLYFSPSFHLTVGCFCPVGLSLS